MNPTETLVNKVWSYCNVLRDAGLSYGDYLEQLTYLIFLKMADEYSRPPYKRDLGIPKGFDWPSLTGRTGADLEAHYIRLLLRLGSEKGLLGQIFTKAQNRIQEPAHLASLVEMIDRETWVIMGADVKGDIYEGLLERNAQDTKSGAGQYFTPRPLIKAMVECVRPEPGKTVCDPACGTGGFFLAAYDFITDPEHYQLNRTQKQALKTKPLTFDDLADFIACYNPGERHKRHETWSEKNPEGRWRKYDYAELIARDKTSLDIFWLKDKSLSDLDNLPIPRNSRPTLSPTCKPLSPISKKSPECWRSEYGCKQKWFH